MDLAEILKEHGVEEGSIAALAEQMENWNKSQRSAVDGQNQKLLDEVKAARRAAKDLESQSSSAAAKQTELEAKIQELTDKAELGDQHDEIQKQVADRVERQTKQMVRDHEAALAALQTELETERTSSKSFRTKLADTQLRQMVDEAIGTVGGVHKLNRLDIHKEARDTFKLGDDGEWAAPDPEDPDDFLRDGKGRRLQPEAWLGAIRTEGTRRWFEAPAGSKIDGFATGVGKTIPAGDPEAFGTNLESIAAGEVTVA